MVLSDLALVARGWLLAFCVGWLLAVAPRPVPAGWHETPRPGGVVRIAYAEFPPVTYRDELGQPAGEMIDLTRRVAVEAGYQPEFLFLPVSRIYLYLKNGTVDLWVGLSDIPSLRNDVLESWVSPISVPLSAWYLHGARPLTHFDDFKGKTVIVIGGYTYGGLIDWLSETTGIRVTEAPNHRAAIEMLKRGRGDYVLDYRQPVRQILTQPADGRIRESEVRTRNAAWLFSLANPQAAVLRDAFDDAYLRLAAKGQVVPVQQPGPAFLLPGISELDY